MNKIVAADESAIKAYLSLKNRSTPLFMFDISRFKERYTNLCKQLSGFEHYYALKSFTSLPVVQAIKDVNGYIDIASVNEMKLLQQANFDFSKVIYTNPHNKAATLKVLYQAGCRAFVIDTIEEYEKLAEYKDVIIYLRVSFQSSAAQIDLSYKFGVPPEEIDNFFTSGHKAPMRISGLCFHAGSQLLDPTVYAKKIKQASEIIAHIEESYGLTIKHLDIGGGMPIEYAEPIPDESEYFEQINNAVEQYIDTNKVSLSTEMGRYLCGPCGTVFCSVVARSVRKGQDWLFLDDGAYGIFADVFSGHQNYASLCALKPRPEKNEVPLIPYIVSGPTCDSLDIVGHSLELPNNIKAGDILYCRNIGAYSTVLSTDFNLIDRTPVVSF